MTSASGDRATRGGKALALAGDSVAGWVTPSALAAALEAAENDDKQAVCAALLLGGESDD